MDYFYGKNSLKFGRSIYLAISGTVFFTTTPFRSQLFISMPIPAPGFSQVLSLFRSQSHWLFAFHPAPGLIGLTHRTQLFLSFVSSMKQMTNKLRYTANRTVSCYQKQPKIDIKNTIRTSAA